MGRKNKFLPLRYVLKKKFLSMLTIRVILLLGIGVIVSSS